MRVVGGGICGVLVLEVRDVLEIEGPLIDVHFKLGSPFGLEDGPDVGGEREALHNLQSNGLTEYIPIARWLVISM